MGKETPLMLSVSGMRGLVGTTLTPGVVARYAASFGNWLLQQRPSGGARGPAHVVIGRDSRSSGQMLELAAASGLLSVGCRVTSLGIVTTPGVAIMTEHLGADGGMVVTASHNPAPWNGLKALRHDGVAPPPQDANAIIESFRADRVAYAAHDRVQTLAVDHTTHGVHVQRVLKHVDAPAIRRRKIKVVLDSVHGAGGPSAAKLLHELGVELVHLFAEPTGQFPHPPEPTRDHLTHLSDAVRAHGADIGMAQDPDADRLALVDEQGRYIGEEYTLALACMEVLGALGSAASGQAVVANLSTSRMIDDIAGRAGARVIRTPVGEANVAAAMRKEVAVIGGEGNGGVIWPPVIHVRDSLAGMALVLSLMARQSKPLSSLVAETRGYAIVKDKLDLNPAVAERLAPILSERFAGERIDRQDGVRVDWPDKWVHARLSNTEPIVRIIAEALDEASARALIAEVRSALSQA